MNIFLLKMIVPYIIKLLNNVISMWLLLLLLPVYIKLSLSISNSLLEPFSMW